MAKHLSPSHSHLSIKASDYIQKTFYYECNYEQEHKKKKKTDQRINEQTIRRSRFSPHSACIKAISPSLQHHNTEFLLS